MNYLKQKLLLTVAALLGGVISVSAQTDVTSTYITNADFSSTTGWTNYSGGGSEHSEGSGLIGTLSLNSKPSTTDATHLATEYCFGFSARWNGRYTYYQQVLENVQAGAYTLSYDVQDVNSSSTKYNMDNHFYVQVGDTKYSDSATEWMNAGASSWTAHTISFTLNETSNVTISFGYGNKENKGTSDCPAIYVSHLKLEVFPFATSSDYEALNTAISAVEGKTWGFDAGEYAPYNYVEVIQALAAAQAIDQNANNSQADVQALTATLNTSMTANAAEVNAIWDPSFEHDYSGQTGNVQPIGWYREKNNYTGDGYNVRYMDLPSGTNTSGHGVFGKFTLMYGEEPGYTLPLNEAYYTLSFIYGGWNEVGTREIQLYNDDNSAELYTKNVTAIDKQAHVTSSAYSTYNGFIKVPAAGNYVLSFYRQSTYAQNQIVLSDFVLKTTTVAEATAYYNSVKTSVESDYDASANGGTEKTAFKNAIDADVSEYSVAQLMEAAANLPTLRDAFVAATPKYDALETERASALAIGVTSEAANAVTMTSASGLDDALHALYALEDAAATSGYTVDATTLFGTWSTQNMDNASGQHWSDNASTSYFDKWSGSGFTSSITSTMTLPVGKYVFKVAGRAAANSINGAFNMSVKIGENDAVQKDFTAKGDTGYGIDTDGAVNYSDGGTYAYNDAGRGWEWRFIGFELDEAASVTMTAYAQIYGGNWVSFTDATLLTTSDNVGVLKDLLNDEITAANAIYASGANVGDGAFQIPTVAGTDFNTAIATAQGVYDNGSATPSEVQTAFDDLNTAKTTYEATTLNAPVSSVQYRIKSTAADAAGWKNLYYVLKKDAGQAHGGYSTRAEVSTTDAFYATAWEFVSVSDNQYKLRMTDADGAVRYLCTNKKGYDDGTATQIRTTTDADKALVVKIIAATGTDGRWFLQNTEDNSYLGGQDAGLFSNSQNYDLAIETATKASVTVSCKAGKFGTVIFPFTPSVADNDDVTFYTVTGVENDYVQMEEVAKNELAANTPYMIKNDGESPYSEKLTGWGTANAASYESNGFTGVFTETTIPASTETIINYVLQTQPVDAQAFYKVTSAFTTTPYKCYLTVNSGSGAHMLKLFFEEEETTGISSLTPNPSPESEGSKIIYDLQGRKVQNPKRGMYIINGKKVVVK